MANKKIKKYSDIDSRLRINPDGNVVVLRGSDVIKQSIKTILSTSPGERVMLPDFGAGIRDYLFEPMEPDTVEGMRNRIESSLENEEPRITIRNVDIRADRKNQTYEISIRYRNNVSGERDEFVGRVRSMSEL